MGIISIIIIISFTQTNKQSQLNNPLNSSITSSIPLTLKTKSKHRYSSHSTRHTSLFITFNSSSPCHQSSEWSPNAAPSASHPASAHSPAPSSHTHSSACQRHRKPLEAIGVDRLDD